MRKKQDKKREKWFLEINTPVMLGGGGGQGKDCGTLDPPGIFRRTSWRQGRWLGIIRITKDSQVYETLAVYL